MQVSARVPSLPHETPQGRVARVVPAAPTPSAAAGRPPPSGKASRGERAGVSRGQMAGAAVAVPLSLAAPAVALTGGGSGCRAFAAAALPALPLADLSTALYNVSVQADTLVANELAALSPVSFAVILVAGLLTSLSPCTLSVLPLTIGYIGGYEGGDKGGSSLAVSGAAFSAGLATTLALLGVAAASLGKAYGQLPLGDGLPIAVSLLAVVMGLNLLEVVQLRLPSFGDSVDVRGLEVPSAVRAYLAGLLFALAASPCSTPVLATLLGYVAQTKDPVLGGGLLLAYTSGYVAPLLAAASFTGALKNIMSLRGTFAWITPASGALLLAGGTYSLLSRTFPS